MGYYVMAAGMKPKDKAVFLKDFLGAVEVDINQFVYSTDVPADKALICVVDNGPFEAAALAFNEAEFKRFHAPDLPNRGNYVKDGIAYFDISPDHERPRRWLLMDRAMAYRLSGFPVTKMP